MYGAQGSSFATLSGLTSVWFLCCSAGPDGQPGSRAPGGGSATMARAVGEAGLYTQLSALHRYLVPVLSFCFRVDE